MSQKQKVIIGISGGVDSSVAALLLKEQGFDVEAVFMKNWQEQESSATTSVSIPAAPTTSASFTTSSSSTATSSCTAAQDFADARAVCNKLHIPLHVVNFSQEYWQRVFQYMLDEYTKGRTPNPDIMCNKEIKFKEFLNHAKTLNADFIATGHYARNIRINNLCKLYKAFDNNKDQSYFLYTLGQQQLAYTLFPLGELLKDTVRDIAKKAQLINYAKKDSTGICFIGERKFKKFLSEYLLAKPGNIIDTNSNIIGKHDGLMFYTLGQRQGLGIGGKKGAGEAPWYVIKKDLTQNILVVAQDSQHPELMSTILHCEDIHWIAEKTPNFPLACAAKIRYRQTEQPCTVTALTKQVYCLTFAEAQRAITPGQAVVFYADDGECLGGGTIISQPDSANVNRYTAPK
jgi:tRNA-uridine 2-sulfurtransferase